MRDVAGVHGSWRRSERTEEALDALGRALEATGAGRCAWVLDAPISNSGRLAGLIRERLPEADVRTADAADAALLALAAEGAVLATSDGGLLDRCGPWTGLVARALPPDAWIVDLGRAG
jgi:hypothetical protein